MLSFESCKQAFLALKSVDVNSQKRNDNVLPEKLVTEDATAVKE